MKIVIALVSIEKIKLKFLFITRKEGVYEKIKANFSIQLPKRK